MNITKRELKSLIREAVEDKLDNQQSDQPVENDYQPNVQAANKVSMILQKALNQLGLGYKLDKSSIVNYLKILDNPKKISTISGSRKQILNKIYNTNKNVSGFNQIEAFKLLRVIETLYGLGDYLINNASKATKIATSLLQ